MATTTLDRGKLSRMTGWIMRLPLADQNPVLQLACTLAIFAVAWFLRVETAPMLPPGFPYVTFFPAVIITSFLFGVRFGLISAVLCGAVAYYYFLTPAYSFSIAGKQVALSFYVFVVATDLLLVHGMQVANQQLIKERELTLNLAHAKAELVLELQQRVAERKRAIDELRESEIKTHLATETAGIGLWRWHIPSGQVTWDKTMFDLYGMPPTTDGLVKYEDYIVSVHPEDAAEQDAVLQDTVSTCGANKREFRILPSDGGDVRYIRAVETARAGPDGLTEWVVGTNLDITEEKNRERHVQLLMGEINHRAKNLLAVVLSVASQTRGVDHADFLKKFSARIRSLAAGQDVLVANQWKRVSLDALIRAQLNHFKDLIGSRITISGDSVQLSPAAVQTIGMAVHELATNAAKYGALSNTKGRIDIDWQKLSDKTSDRLVMNWIESEGPAVFPPKEYGFGSMVTGKVVEMGLGGEVTANFAPTGFSWRLDCPFDQISERAA
jgi:two-component sensor histidine kinase/PAS domain-containing protein